nr:hypothetical protein [Corallococcus macrosporus]
MTNGHIATSLLCAFASLALGCSSGTRSTVKRSTPYALTSCSDTVSCCLQRFPGMPEACGLSAAEAAVLMTGAQAATDTAPVAWDDSHNANLPEWKRTCIRAYGDCKQEGWKGPCYACFQLCEGQHEWPGDKCYPVGK